MREVDRIIKILKEHKKELEKNFSIKEIGIFGSYIRDEQIKESDIDIYVEFDIEKLTFDKYLKFIEYLEKLTRKNRPYYQRWFRDNKNSLHKRGNKKKLNL